MLLKSGDSFFDSRIIVCCDLVLLHKYALHSDILFLPSAPLPPCLDEDELTVGTGDAAEDICECSSGEFDSDLGLCGETYIRSVCHKPSRAKM